MSGLFVRSLLGGFYVGLALLSSLLVAHIPEFGGLLRAVVFPVGILLVIYANGALFTGVAGQFATRGIFSRKGNTFTFNQEPLKQFGKDLTVSLIGNIIGIAALTLLLGRQIGSIDVRVNTPVLHLFTWGILCNIMVYLALNAKMPLTQAIPIFIFILAGFTHSIADIALMAFSGQYHWFIIPVILGNLVGGVVFSVIAEAAKPKPA
ncbi:formate/nitrite transporter family protein [Candidatus Saccharibacteria bacterium]|nr:formate/nitrite transporter family protein [Candidatus Saccharibacteria bacterium]